MAKTFNEFLQIDRDIYTIYEKNQALLAEFLHTGKIPKTAHAFLLFIENTNFIKEGIFELYESRNLYGINILFRSLIEHFLRFQYMMLRLAIEKNDNIGEEYLTFCSLSEHIDTGKAWKDVAFILDKNPKEDPYELLKKLDPNLSKYTRKEIKDKAEQFRYKNIIKFIDDKVNKGKIYEANSFLLNIIPEYSDLSSFVHGGPGAVIEMAKHATDEKLEVELIKRIELTFDVATTVKSHSFLMFKHFENRFDSAYTGIINLLKK